MQIRHATSAARGVSSDASTPEGRRRIFEHLFNDTELVLAVGEALRRDDPAAVNDVLARANG